MATCDDRLAPGDAGGIVVGWLLRISAVLAVIGLIAFDGISIVTVRFALEDDGNQAARSASDTWERTHDIRAALASAQQTAAESNAANVVVPTSLRIDPDGTAHLTIKREASTIVAVHIPPLRRYCDLTTQGQGRGSTT